VLVAGRSHGSQGLDLGPSMEKGMGDDYRKKKQRGLPPPDQVVGAGPCA
jgi:hypothetical protein